MCCGTETFVSHTSSSFNRVVQRLLRPFYKVNMNHSSFIPALAWSRRFVNNIRSIPVWATTTCSQSFISSPGLSPIVQWESETSYGETVACIRWLWNDIFVKGYKTLTKRACTDILKMFVKWLPVSASVDNRSRWLFCIYVSVLHMYHSWPRHSSGG
jgi:hypothetical protein